MRKHCPSHKSNLTRRIAIYPELGFRIPVRLHFPFIPTPPHRPTVPSMQEHPFPRQTRSSGRPPCEICREIVEEFTDTARWLAGQDAAPDQFRKAVAAFEARKLARFGFTLDSALSVGSMVHFNLRFADNGDLCASMDVDAHTGNVLVQHACA